eukprot:1609029-Prymnesium_polylepis.1
MRSVTAWKSARGDQTRGALSKSATSTSAAVGSTTRSAHPSDQRATSSRCSSSRSEYARPPCSRSSCRMARHSASLSPPCTSDVSGSSSTMRGLRRSTARTTSRTHGPLLNQRSVQKQSTQLETSM